MSQSVNVEYTIQDIQFLTQMLDIAVKAGGIGVVVKAAALHQKHLDALKATTTPTPEG